MLSHIEVQETCDPCPPSLRESDSLAAGTHRDRANAGEIRDSWVVLFIGVTESPFAALLLQFV